MNHLDKIEIEIYANFKLATLNSLIFLVKYLRWEIHADLVVDLVSFLLLDESFQTIDEVLLCFVALFAITLG